MTNQEILTKAIQKAIASGWRFFEDSTLLPVSDWEIDYSIAVWNSYLKERMYLPQQVVIFNHDFAKALWGEEERKNPYLVPKEERGGRFTGNAFEVITKKGWKSHLQDMVIAEDPIAYLSKNI